MRRISLKAFLMLAAMAGCAATYHWMVSASPVSAAASRLSVEPNEPNDPVPGPEICCTTQLDDDPNDPGNPEPGPEIVALAWSEDDPNEPDGPSPGPECI
jgi:hypothetical protein